MTDAALSGLLQNLGVFAPVALLGWWVIRTQRHDLIEERDAAREALAEEREAAGKILSDERASKQALFDRVIALAQSGEKTIAELTKAIADLER